VPTIHGLFASPVSFQSFLDEVPLGAMLLDRDRRILFMNRAMEALTGFERRDACGIRCMNILRNAVCVEGCPLEHDDFPAIGAPECLEGNIVNRERKKIPVRITVVPMIDLVGACCGFLETVEDLRLSGSGNWKADHAYRFGHLIGNSPQMEKIFQILPMVGQTESSVLITGETGDRDGQGSCRRGHPPGFGPLQGTVHQGQLRGLALPFTQIFFGTFAKIFCKLSAWRHKTKSSGHWPSPKIFYTFVG